MSEKETNIVDEAIKEDTAQASEHVVVEETTVSDTAVTDPVDESVTHEDPVADKPVEEEIVVTTESELAVTDTTAKNDEPPVEEKPEAVSEPVPEPIPAPAVAEPIKEVPRVSNRRTTDMLRAEVRESVSDDRARAWSREQLLTFLETGVQPDKTLRGNWPHDERRAAGVVTWTASELLDWLEGKILTPGNISPDEIWDEVYLRNKINGTWPLEVAKDFILHGTVPKSTVDGILVNDRFRDIKSVGQWTYKELRAAIKGEITSQHKRSVLLSELRKRLGVSEAYGEKLLLKTLESDKLESTMQNTLLTAKLSEYRTTMSKGGRHLTEDTAGAAQTMFYKTIRQVMGREYVEFHEGWIIILDFINEHYNTLFNPGVARRGWGRMNLAPQARSTFEDLLTLMIHTRSPINRVGEAKMYNLEQILRHVASEKERQNIVTFYTAQ